jgi:ABC-2 type transport system ATP-binding protein
VITFERLSKQHGAVIAVDDLSVTVRPGRVTALLGPNGAGKSTTMRVLLGLDHPDSGRALVDGLPYRAHPEPLRRIGAHLDGRAFHPGRSARQHLLGLARVSGIPARRVGEVLEVVGLAEVARRRVGTFSLGMGQRLGIAAALLGDPGVLVLDEPVNGLDTDGVRWIRGVLRGMGAEGRTVLLSSHLLAEVQQTADHVLVLNRGRLVADRPMADLVGPSVPVVLLRTPDADRAGELRARLPGARLEADRSAPDDLRVSGVGVERLGETAQAVGMRIHHLAPVATSLEAAYLQLVGDDGAHVAGRRSATEGGA